MEHLHAGPEIPPGLLCPSLPLTEGGFAKGEAEDSKELLAWEPPAGARSPGRQALYGLRPLPIQRRGQEEQELQPHL